MSVNPYEPSSDISTVRRTRSTRWLVRTGIALLTLAVVCLLAPIAGMIWALSSLANSTTPPTPSDIALGISLASIPSIAVIPIGILGIVLLIAGFVIRERIDGP